MKKILATLLAVSLTFGSVALPAAESGVNFFGFGISASAEDDLTYGDFKYDILEDGTIEIDRYEGNDEIVVIPSVIDGKKVTRIGNDAFSGCESLTTITMPDSVISIGDGAFSYCSSLTSITIPNGVTNINSNTFYWCDNLSNVIIPESVTNIDKSAFQLCYSLTNITIPNSVTSIGDCAFYCCYSLTSITIPDSVTSFGASVFDGTKWLKNRQQDSSLVIVNNILLDGSTASGDVIIPDGITIVNERAFSNCENVTTVTVPSSVTSLCNAPFIGCSKLTSIKIDDKNAYYSSENGVLFDKNKSTLLAYPAGKSQKEYTIPNSVTAIDHRAFSGCQNLTNITIPDSVASIGYGAFSNCTNLMSITIPAGVTSISDLAFSNCESLTNITIPNSITSIDEYAFSGCRALTNITIPNSVTNIGESAFYGCENLTSVTMPSSIKNIGEAAFYSCKGLTSIAISDGVTNIGNHAFEGCRSLTSITIPNSVTSIGDSTFSWCESLTNITIPNSVTSIGHSAFFYCISLADVYYTGTADEWNSMQISEYGNDNLLNATIHYNYGAHTHSYISTITKQPTCTAEGVKTFTCECGDTYTESIPAKGHTIVTDKAVPATCTKAGKTEGSHCSVCGEVIKAQTEIKATGHKSSNWITDKAAAIGVKGKKHKECTVCKKVLETADIPALAKPSISKASVSLSTSTYAYDGKAKRPSVTVKLNAKTLKKGTDYTVSYSNNTKVGTATIKITAKGNYTGTISKTFKIKNNFAKSTVSGISTKAFTGKAITQKITVKFGGKTLKSGTDYTVSYSNNKNVGTATVKIVGKGSYTGTITKTFKINPAKQEIKKLSAKSKGFSATWVKKGSATGYEVQYSTNSSFKNASKTTITSKNTSSKTVSKLKAKTKYYVRVRSYTTVKGTKYYGAWSTAKTVTTGK